MEALSVSMAARGEDSMDALIALCKAEEAEERANSALQPSDKAAWLRLRDRWLEKAIELEEKEP